ncbi:MAG: hypothetical protein IT368_08845 [Candidatus Hydrogenedentes bacterium]|nr:hypothetical protein [Candidatus Hydrogenedentota bacterium]
MKRLGNIITVLALVATAGAAVGLWVSRPGQQAKSAASPGGTAPATIQEAVEHTLGMREPAALPAVPAGEAADNPGWKYARAMQAGDWDYVIDHTLWMQERLSLVQVQGGPDATVAEARADLLEGVSTRPPAQNLLREAGVEDQYVFHPEAELTLLSVDAGREDLETPAAGRAWIEVQYPDRMSALLDEGGLPIRRLTVGVNYTAEGAVLKAGIVGNLEIDWESVRLDWDDQGSAKHAIGQVSAL